MATQRAFRTTISGFVVAGAFLLGPAASAQENPDYTAPAPVVEVTTPPSQPVANVAQTPAQADTETETAGAGLPVTGSDAVQLLVVGGLLVSGGAGILAARRRATA